MFHYAHLSCELLQKVNVTLINDILLPAHSAREWCCELLQKVNVTLINDIFVLLYR